MIETQLSDLTGENRIVPVLLGWKAMYNKYSELVKQPCTVGEKLDIDNPLILVALGLISTNETFMRWLADSEESTAPEDAETMESYLNARFFR